MHSARDEPLRVGVYGIDLVVEQTAQRALSRRQFTLKGLDAPLSHLVAMHAELRERLDPSIHQTALNPLYKPSNSCDSVFGLAPAPGFAVSPRPPSALRRRQGVATHHAGFSVAFHQNSQTCSDNEPG
jgi:hypothetical protein